MGLGVDANSLALASDERQHPTTVKVTTIDDGRTQVARQVVNSLYYPQFDNVIDDDWESIRK
jgi:hypothetical protein